MIRVALVAPAVALRAGLRALFESSEDIEVIAEATTTVELGPHLEPVDVLVATEIPSQGEINQLFVEQDGEIALLLITDEIQAAQMLSGLPVTAWGLLPEEASAEEMLAAVSALHQGLAVASPQVMQKILVAAVDSEEVEPLTETLTERESQVLQLIAQGLPNKQIAYLLGISEHTVKFHVSSIYTKLGVSNRTEAVRQGVRSGLVVL